MLHVVAGHNFHGHYRITFRGPNRAFLLSRWQARRYRHELCPFQDCSCGGGYGDGPSSQGAHIKWAQSYGLHELRDLALSESEIQAVYDDYLDALILIPATEEAE